MLRAYPSRQVAVLSRFEQAAGGSAFSFETNAASGSQQDQQQQSQSNSNKISKQTPPPVPVMEGLESDFAKSNNLNYVWAPNTEEVRARVRKRVGDVVMLWLCIKYQKLASFAATHESEISPYESCWQCGSC